MPNRVVFIGAPEADAAAFEARARRDFPGLSLLATNERRDALGQLGETEVLIGHYFHFDDELLGQARRLRWIQSLTSGTDQILKLGSLDPRVLVTSTRGMHGAQMSELVFLQMLALIRDFPRMQRNQAAARWERWPQGVLGGKTVVIVGVGAIAEALAPRCAAFGMRVFGVSNSRRLPADFIEVFAREDLPSAAALADFLVVLVPHSPQNDDLIDERVLAAMKSGAFLINVARGGVLDERALLAALRAGRLAGAALDVFRREPLPSDDPLWREPRLIITPHIGGMSSTYLDQAYAIVRENLQKYLAGHYDSMQNLVAR